MKTTQPPISRRDFIEKSVRGAGILAVASTAMQFETRGRSADSAANAFAYDVGSLAKTDPALLKYEEVKRFTVPGSEPRRLELGPEDKVYVATKNGVSILDREGGSLGEVVSSSPARCLAVAPDG